jgi:hypothetical protein
VFPFSGLHFDANKNASRVQSKIIFLVIAAKKNAPGLISKGIFELKVGFEPIPFHGTGYETIF